MTISELADECDKLPTILSFKDEVRIIRLVKEFSLADIKVDLNQFNNILTKLFDAHFDGGMFDLTEDNQSFFLEFADWLRAVEKAIGGILNINIDVFSYTVEDLERFFGQPRRDGPQAPA
jgi:hypothetical protein